MTTERDLLNELERVFEDLFIIDQNFANIVAEVIA